MRHYLQHEPGRQCLGQLATESFFSTLKTERTARKTGHAEILNGFSHGSEVVIENAGHDLFMGSPKVVEDIVAFFSHKPIQYTHIPLPPLVFVLPAAPTPPTGD